MRRLMLPMVALAVAAVVAFPASVTAHTDCAAVIAASLAGTAEPLVDLTPLVPRCFDSKAEDEFKHQYLEFYSDEATEGAQVTLAASNVEYMIIAKLSGTCNDRDHARVSRQRAQIVLGQLLPSARKYLDRMGFDLVAMQRAIGFASENTGVQASLKTQLEALDGELKSLFQVNGTIRAAANKLQALSCDAAVADAELGFTQFTNAMKGIRAARDEISRLLVEFDRAPCKDFAKQVNPMPAGQVSAAAGGGGTQRGTAGKLDVLAPRQLHLVAGGGAVLPLTLTAHANGFVRIELTRGKTMVTGVSGLMSTGSAGLRIAVPSGASRGSAELRVVFSSSHQTLVATVSIRII